LLFQAGFPRRVTFSENTILRATGHKIAGQVA
jgi:hypothetical protein